MTELIIKAFIFLALAISMPFAAGLAFACAAFSVIAAISARRVARKSAAANKTNGEIAGVGFTPELPIVKDDKVDCEAGEVAVCGARSPREVPLLYEYDAKETNEYAKLQLSDVMRLIGKTEDSERLSTVKRAIADAGKRSAASTAKKRDYPV